MISVTLSQLTDILNGELQGADITLDAVTTDTRKLTPGCVGNQRLDYSDRVTVARLLGVIA